MTLPVYQEFLSHFRKGIMRPNRYHVEFNLPRGVVTELNGFVHSQVGAAALRARQLAMNATGSINIKCHTAMFPQRSLATSERLQNSSPFRTPYSANYDPVTFSFYADGDGDTRRYLDLWQNTVINVRSNTLNFYNEFVSDIKMWHVNETGQRTYGVHLIEAYPLAVGALDISFANMNNTQNIVGSFAYRRWEAMNL